MILRCLFFLFKYGTLGASVTLDSFKLYLYSIIVKIYGAFFLRLKNFIFNLLFLVMGPENYIKNGFFLELVLKLHINHLPGVQLTEK